MFFAIVNMLLTMFFIVILFYNVIEILIILTILSLEVSDIQIIRY